MLAHLCTNSLSQLTIKKTTGVQVLDPRPGAPRKLHLAHNLRKDKYTGHKTSGNAVKDESDRSSSSNERLGSGAKKPWTSMWKSKSCNELYINDMNHRDENQQVQAQNSSDWQLANGRNVATSKARHKPRSGGGVMSIMKKFGPKSTPDYSKGRNGIRNYASVEALATSSGGRLCTSSQRPGGSLEFDGCGEQGAAESSISLNCDNQSRSEIGNRRSGGAAAASNVLPDLREFGPRPDIINSVMEKTLPQSAMDSDSQTTTLLVKPDSNSSHQDLHELSSNSQTNQNESLFDVNNVELDDNANKFGYEIGDLDQFLTMASLQRPANIPMVVTCNVNMHVRKGGEGEKLPIAMGFVVNALYKDGRWLYVRTAHGSEGLLPRKACTPLGITPEPINDSSIKSPWDLDGDNSVIVSSLKPSVSIVTPSEDCGRSNCKLSKDTLDKEAHAAPHSTHSPEGLYENLRHLYLKVPGFNGNELKRDTRISKANKTILRFNKTDTQKLLDLPTTVKEFQSTPKCISNNSDLGSGARMLVSILYNYKSKGTNTVTVQKGEQVTLLHHVSSDWIKIKTETGLEGLVPTAYTTLGKQCFL